VTSPSENARILAETTAWNDGFAPDIVWANAGSAYPHLFAETSIETLRAQMDIDYWAGAYLAREAILLWTGAGGAAAGPRTTKDDEATRHFVMTSSLCAFVGLAGYGPYGPAKAALRNLADTLRSELALYNGARGREGRSYPAMENHIVFPGGILSPGFEAENKVKHGVTAMLEADDKPQTAEEVAEAAFGGLVRRDYLITTAPLGMLMKGGAMAGSRRNGLGVWDTVVSWVAGVVWLFVGPDLESKVYKWGKEKGV